MVEGWADTVDAHRARQRRRISEAALELVAERGMAQVSMAELARRAGVSRPTLYRYFHDVESALIAWVGDEIDRVVGELAVRLAATEDPVAALRTLVEVHVDAFVDARYRLGMETLRHEAVSPALRTEVERHVDGVRSILGDVLDRGVARGVFGPHARDPLVREVVLGALGGLRGALLEGRGDRAEAVELVYTLLVKALRT